MKALIVSLLFPVLLKSCEGIPDQTGTPPPTIVTNTGSGSDTGNNTSGTTDVPIDGGLSILLVAGAAYGVKRYRNSKQKKD
jgi:hypothetical protein